LLYYVNESFSTYLVTCSGVCRRTGASGHGRSVTAGQVLVCVRPDAGRRQRGATGAQRRRVDSERLSSTRRVRAFIRRHDLGPNSTGCACCGFVVLLIFHMLYFGSYSLFLGFYVSFYLLFLGARKWFVNPVLAIRPVCSLLVLLCHCWLKN